LEQFPRHADKSPAYPDRTWLKPILARSKLNTKEEFVPIKDTDEVVDNDQLLFEFDEVVNSEDSEEVEISVADFCVLSTIEILLFKFFSE
jgi:hypothetical protein